ncbi:MAG TPA: hypothetical protein PKI78_09745, partial [Anaerolineales bacterium]|nr:hypothetical protein [Anaerolineales bacterium]
MSEGKVEFRRARTGDIEAAIPLLYSSGPAVFDFIFKHAGHTSQDFLRYTLSDGAGELGYRNHVVGEMDGKVIAIGAAFGGETTLPFFLSAARQIA